MKMTAGHYLVYPDSFGDTKSELFKLCTELVDKLQRNINNRLMGRGTNQLDF